MGTHRNRPFATLRESAVPAPRHPLTLIMFDVDHFQKVNDDQGNLSGDSILKELVTRIQCEFLTGRDQLTITGVQTCLPFTIVST